MPVFISLLRGINVGGNKIIRMDTLRALYEALGFTKVQSLLQSGNVVFSTGQTDRAALISRIESEIEQRYGFHADVMIRTSDEVSHVIENQPFPADRVADPKRLLVTFLAAVPAASAVEALLKAHTGPEDIHHSGQELFLFYPDGAGSSKLTNTWIESKLKVSGTARNWNTVTALLSLAREVEAGV